ncbi:Uncharacterised protein [Bordetella pertussis]|nr:Uncharacterised protein [Bordetella pertussis]
MAEGTAIDMAHGQLMTSSATGASMPARPRRSPPAAPRQIGQAQYSTTGTVISKAAQFISTMAQSSVASASAGMPSLRT